MEHLVKMGLSIQLEVLCKKTLTKNFVNFLVKHRRWSPFLIKLEAGEFCELPQSRCSTKQLWKVSELIDQRCVKFALSQQNWSHQNDVILKMFMHCFRACIVELQHILVALVVAELSSRGCFIRKGVLKNLKKITGKYLCQSLFVSKFADLSL